MPRYLWVKWEGPDGGPRAKRFKFFINKIRKRTERFQLVQGTKYVVLRSDEARRGTMGTIDLQLEEGADPEEAAKAFVDAEGGELSEYWVEEVIA